MLIQHQHAGDGRREQAVQPLGLVGQVAHRGLLGRQQPVPLLLGPLAGGHVGEGDHEPAGQVRLIRQGGDGGVHPQRLAGVPPQAEVGAQLRTGRPGARPLPPDPRDVPGMHRFQPRGAEDVPASWPFSAHQRSLTYAHVPVSSVRAIPTGASSDSSRTRASLAASAALARSSSVTSRAKLQKKIWPPDHERQRGQLHRPLGAVTAQDGQVHPAGELSRVLAAQELLGRLQEPGPVAFRDEQVPHALAEHVARGGGRTVPSAAGLKATILRAASATTTASGAASISASVTARRSAISLVSSTRRIRAAMTVASARAVDCHSAGHWDRCRHQDEGTRGGIARQPGHGDQHPVRGSWRFRARARSPVPGRSPRPRRPRRGRPAAPAICTIRAGSTAACG